MKKILALACLTVSHLTCHAQLNWGAPTTISTAGVNASDPHIATDSNGNATAVWVENGIIKASTIPAGGSWSAITTLSNVANTSSNPRVKLDGNGNATAIWLENGIVSSAALPFGGSWIVETALSNALGGASQAVLWVDSNGDKVAIWTRNGFIEAAQYVSLLGVWGLVSQLSSNGAEDHPDIYIGEGGTIVAVFHSVVSGNDLVYSTKGSVDGSWGSPVNMIAATPGAHHNYPKVIVDSNGNATAAWYRYGVSGSTYSDVELLSSSLSSTASAWTAFPTVLSSGSGEYNPANLFASMSLDSNGDVIVLSTNSYDGSTFNVESAVLPFGGTWQGPGGIDLMDTYAYQVDVSATTSGTALANFMFYDGTNVNIQSVESSINGKVLNFWTAPINVSLGMDNAYPRVSAKYQTSSGTVFGSTVWMNNNGSNNVVQASVGTNAAIGPPTNLSAVQGSNNFGVFTEYFNTITWTASTDLSVTGYLLYRNGVIFAEVSSSTTSYVDSNAVQGQTVTYGVASINSSMILSPIVTTKFSPI